MNAVDVIRHQMKSAYAWLQNIISDVTQEEANWQPPGTRVSTALNAG